jgi:hypothetical protein
MSLPARQTDFLLLSIGQQAQRQQVVVNPQKSSPRPDENNQSLSNPDDDRERD